MEPQRLELADRKGTELRADDGTRFVLRRLRPGVLLAQIIGYDKGGLGRAPFDEIERELGRAQPIELFFDLRDAAGAVGDVRHAWTEWFQRNRPYLARVTVLASSRFVNLTLEIAKLFSRTGELIQIYSDQLLFEQAMAVAVGAPITLTPAR